mgnify:CR=1 FL=1
MGTDLAPCRRRPCTVALPKHRSTRTRSNTGSPPRRAVVAAVLVAGADGGGSGAAAAAGGAAWWGTGSGAGARGGEHGENDRSQTWENNNNGEGGCESSQRPRTSPTGASCLPHEMGGHSFMNVVVVLVRRRGTFRVLVHQYPRRKHFHVFLRRDRDAPGATAVQAVHAGKATPSTVAVAQHAPTGQRWTKRKQVRGARPTMFVQAMFVGPGKMHPRLRVFQTKRDGDLGDPVRTALVRPGHVNGQFSCVRFLHRCRQIVVKRP